MLSIEKKPKTYRSRVDWYASVWQADRPLCEYPIEVYRTKREAINAARALWQNGASLVSIGWIPRNANPGQAISQTRCIEDRRS